MQSALTHGHPTALAASDLTAHTVWLLTQGTGPAELLRLLREYARRTRSVYRAGWLGDLAEHAHDPRRASFTARGCDECLAALNRVEAALAAADPETDLCLAAGEGWIAEEAFAAGLYCFLLLSDDAPAVVRRAAYSSGDSDSIAALAGVTLPCSRLSRLVSSHYDAPSRSYTPLSTDPAMTRSVSDSTPGHAIRPAGG